MALMRSWVESAEGSDFSLQNLPLGVFRRADGAACIGTAIGDWIFDLRAAADVKLLPGELNAPCREGSLNRLMETGRESMGRYCGLGLMDLLSEERMRKRVEPLLVARAGTEMLLSAQIGDYTVSTLRFTTRRCGAIIRPDNPLVPNYKYVPIGYHGRASSIVVSGTDVRRPSGQTKGTDAAAPVFGPSRSLDYELEVGFFVGSGNGLGEPIPLSEAERHIFGLCLVNDWSARDVQTWEYEARWGRFWRKFCDYDFAVGGDDGCAAAISCSGIHAGGG